MMNTTVLISTAVDWEKIFLKAHSHRAYYAA